MGAYKNSTRWTETIRNSEFECTAVCQYQREEKQRECDELVRMKMWGHIDKMDFPGRNDKLKENIQRICEVLADVAARISLASRESRRAPLLGQEPCRAAGN